ncbi:uncharacterized protein [Magallana gigas]|uniref:uncharacterized protein isoform X2 n=1 Tax=Magallana gigas TaxID=29159 RepID=UPI0033429129
MLTRVILIFLLFVLITLAFAQNREIVTGCIAGNVTMQFKPALLAGKEVKTYVWNKVRGVNKDPSFAKFEPSDSLKLQIYFNEEHQVQNRLFHYPEEPATLYLTNLRKSDQQQYTLVISYVDYVGTPTDWIIDLQVQDVCFEKPKEVGKCAASTCYTGENGVLKTPDSTELAVNGYKQVNVCDDNTSGNYSCCNTAGTCLVQDFLEPMGILFPPFVQKKEAVRGCIAGNVTMQFKPALLDGKEVKTYVWNKVRGVNKDPSFAKFEPSDSLKLQIYFNEEHQVQNRLFHYPEEPATLYLTNLRKSDQQQYTLVISYVDYVGTPTDWIIDLQVQDVCFEKPKEVGKCAVSTCYTGENGVLKTPDSTELAVNGYKQVNVCDDNTSGNYSCCNTAGTCLVQDFLEPMGILFPPFVQKKEAVRGCIAGNVTMQFKPALLASKEVKTYVWNKVRGVNKDPSFAKFEPSDSLKLQIYFNEEHQVQNRLFHYPEEPATLYLTNLRKSDQQQYTLVISYVDYVGTPTDWIIDLQVQDVCFEKPKEVGKCAVSTCYTGENGVLKTPDSTELAVNGYKQVNVCDDNTSGNYSCCNTAGTCLVQDFLEPMGILFPPFVQKKEAVRGCIAGNVTMQFKPALLASKEVKTYVWNKVRGVNKDPSFAKFEPSDSLKLQIYFNEEHQVQNRLFHYPEEPATLYLTNLRKSDQQQYTLVISYVDYVGTPTDWIIDLQVQDVCFEKPKEVGKCAVSTCYTGENGVLKTPDSTELAVNGYKQVNVCDDNTSGNYSCCNTAGTCLVQDFLEPMAFAQNRETLRGCIAGNVTMQFKPALLADKEVKTYVWNKRRGVNKDPSFAKFEPGASPEFEIYYDNEHQVQNRLIHYPDEPATLYLTNLKKSDEQRYTVFIGYVDYVGTPTDWIIDLQVQDVCFEKPKEVGKCAVSTCYTGENGVLKTPDSTELAVNGYKQVNVCDDNTSGNYSCCNTAGTCLVQDFLEPMGILFPPFVQKKEAVRGCIAGNVTMQFKPALLASKEVKTYVWNKVRGVNKDPSFAKFEPNFSSQLEIYFNEEHQVQNRIFHNPEEPATLYLTDLRKSDQEQYTLVISYADYVGTPTEYRIELEVQDVCFEKPKTVDKCAVTTCYTGDNGVLKTPDDREETVNGLKVINVCENRTTGNYYCCNSKGSCIVQGVLSEPSVSDSRPKKRKKISIDELQRMQYEVLRCEKRHFGIKYAKIQKDIERSELETENLRLRNAKLTHEIELLKQNLAQNENASLAMQALSDE